MLRRTEEFQKERSIRHSFKKLVNLYRESKKICSTWVCTGLNFFYILNEDRKNKMLIVILGGNSDGKFITKRN